MYTFTFQLLSYLIDTIPHIWSEWNLVRFGKMGINYFQILLSDVTFYLYHVLKLVFNVLIKTWNKAYNRDRQLKG